jgi:NAD(P)-dependent dehydrogenase (short-subunit alcohol dehydrogenase family)
MRFKNKIAIITGGAGGIGQATAQRLASEGAVIMLADLDENRLNKVIDEIKKTGCTEIYPAICNVSKEEEVASTVKNAIDQFGRLDIVVNNAGLMNFKPLEQQTEEDWINILKVDLLGAFFFIKHSFLNMKSGGAIVNVASIHAIETEPLVAPYAAAKAALVSLTRSAALEGKPKGIRVNAILPGAIDTPMLWENPNVKSGVEKIDPTEVGKPESIANSIAFLAAPDTEFVQGAILVVDGGRLDRL